MRDLGKEVKRFSDEALACMQAYHWPGNVRELQNEVRHMLVMGTGDELGAELLTTRVLRAMPGNKAPALESLASLQGSLKDRVEALEARILCETLITIRANPNTRSTVSPCRRQTSRMPTPGARHHVWTGR
jgi:two-component system response regulator HupR/HoxA